MRTGPEGIRYTLVALTSGDGVARLGRTDMDRYLAVAFGGALGADVEDLQTRELCSRRCSVQHESDEEGDRWFHRVTSDWSERGAVRSNLPGGQHSSSSQAW